jgi:hypothetical protein
MPKLFLIDQDSGIIAALNRVEFDMLDASLTVYKDHGVRFESCPVAGHNTHGLIERKIKTAQENLREVWHIYTQNAHNRASDYSEVVREHDEQHSLWV